MTTFSQAVDYLLNNGYLAYINGEITITGKFNREFRPIPVERAEQLFPENPTIVSREAIWKKFIEDAEIPHKVTATDGKLYTIRQYSPAIANKLVQIIRSVPDYKILIESTKLYYRSNAYKLTLSNYIDRRVWSEEYDRYAKAKADGKLDNILSAGSGGNRFED